MKKSTSNAQIREELTNVIVDAMAKELPPWRQSWNVSKNMGNPCNFVSRRRYTGINPLLLYLTSLTKGYESKNWGTANSWIKNTGGHVIKGEISTRVVRFAMIPKKDPKTKKIMRDKEGKDITFPMMKYYPLFNVDQIQAPAVEPMLGWKKPKLVEKADVLKIDHKSSWTKQQLAEAIHDAAEQNLQKYRAVIAKGNDEPEFGPAENLLSATGVEIIHGGARASYYPVSDHIKMPEKKVFHSMREYYEVIFHELIHWTGHPSRLNRSQKSRKEDRDEYAFEELVAEIGACFVCAELQIPCAEKMLEKSQSYVQHWLSQMSGDSSYIFDAARLASEAADFVFKFIGASNEEITEEIEDNKAA